MTFAAAAIGAGGAIGSSALSSGAGKKAAEEAEGARIRGYGEAEKQIKKALGRYQPYVRGGREAYRETQQLYGLGAPTVTPALTAGQQAQLTKILAIPWNRRTDWQKKKAVELQGINKAHRDSSAAASAYKASPDYNLAQTVGQPQEEELRALSDVYGREAKAASEAYTQQEQALRDAYGIEERALRGKIERGDITLDPGYQFRLEQGQQALERGAAARGGLLSGQHLKDLEAYSQGQASQEFGAGMGRLYDLYGLGRADYGRRYGEGLAEYARRYGEGRAEYGRRYGETEQQRGFEIDRFGRRIGGLRDISGQGFQATGQQAGLYGTLAGIAGGVGEAGARGAEARGQAQGGFLDDLAFLSLLYGSEYGRTRDRKPKPQSSSYLPGWGQPPYMNTLGGEYAF